MKTTPILLPTVSRKVALWVSALSALAIEALFMAINPPLNTPAAPLGIVSFELAGTPAKAAEILASWDAFAQRLAAFGLGLDYLFMLAYASALSLACWASGDLLKPHRFPLASLSTALILAPWVAAAFDALENTALALILIGGRMDAVWPALARFCAIIKFALLFLALVYALYGLALKFLLRQR